MTKLKSYRPFITKNFLWEFPTHFKLKEASEFLGDSIAETTDYISNTAKNIMRNNSIYWFLQDKRTKELVGLIAVENIDQDKKSGKLVVQLSVTDSIDKEEIADRLVTFVKEQIDLDTLEFEALDHIVQEKFTNNGYNISSKELKRS
ncbi:hypothetical protein M5C72_11360 [Companilactobacillus allii]|uniref:N-acetyltransferase n=1 Tax=Companilactobacillus allii TaxID=1847728 RepID=A0A1P8Q0J8_9LACO|nr:hypothetical protein [Companilactobacillus allii]APX71347.1 hypothetical protein BTM29_01725 [Companilactobacillus allii]USQ68428.1 hypothetical protein M5C72_11360 [Companilactobacillus allii]